MRFVLDCSVAISWCLPDETNAYAAQLWLLLANNNEAIVPSIFWLEIVNVLIVAERRGRTTETQTREALEMLKSLNLIVDPNTVQQSTGATLALSRQYNLAAYDAAYLELAIREQLLLATSPTRTSGPKLRSFPGISCGIIGDISGIAMPPFPNIAANPSAITND